MAKPAYRRILLKLSGEIFAPDAKFQFKSVDEISAAIKSISDAGVQTAIVLGGGNILRGASVDSDSGIARPVRDQMGMLATVINALAFREHLQQAGLDACILSAINMPQVCELYTRANALQRLEQSSVVIFAGGTGSPYLTTDTAASIRAAEIGANLMVKATKVDGVYDADPMHDSKAKRYEKISYDEVLASALKVMDATAVIICRDNDIPVRVVGLNKADILYGIAVKGDNEGTLMSGGTHG